MEDEKAVVEQLREYFDRLSGEEGITSALTHYGSAEEFLENGNEHQDIVLMDIMLPGMNGMEAAKAFREKDSGTVLIFVTNMARFAVKGYEVNALDFVVKPVSYQQFKVKLLRAAAAVERDKDVCYTVTQKNGLYRFAVRDLCYVEVWGHVLKYHLEHEVIETRGSMSEAEKTLKEHGFIRCHSSYLVNPRHILHIRGYEMEMSDGTTVQISHPKKKTFMAQLARWMEGEG